MFVGDVHNGNIYHFDLNEVEQILILGGGLLADKVADSDSELEEAGGGAGIIFGKGFGGITDSEVDQMDISMLFRLAKAQYTE